MKKLFFAPVLLALFILVGCQVQQTSSDKVRDQQEQTLNDAVNSVGTPAQVTDGGNVIHATEPIQLPKDDRKKYEVCDQAEKAAVAWLDKNYPDWQNPAAHWD